MRNLIGFAVTFLIVLFGSNVIAQNETKQIRKEVQMEKINDSVTLTIKTIDGNKITEEVFTGEEAEKMLAELEKVDEKKIVSSQEIKEEIHIEEVEGIKKLTITRTENGEISETVYFGEEADKKIAEIESRENNPIKVVMEEK